MPTEHPENGHTASRRLQRSGRDFHRWRLEVESSCRKAIGDDRKQVSRDDVAQFMVLIAALSQPIGVEANARHVFGGLAGELPTEWRNHPGPADDFSRLDPIYFPMTDPDRKYGNMSSLNEEEIVGRVSKLSEVLALFESKRFRPGRQQRQESIVDAFEEGMRSKRSDEAGASVRV